RLTLVSHTWDNSFASPDPRTAPGPTPTVGSFAPVISADGSHIAFVSYATNLVFGQTGTVDTTDVFLYDRQTGTNILVSGTNGSPFATANNYSDSPALNSDGSRVAFRSAATNLVPGQVTPPGSRSNVFLFDPQSVPVLTLVSHAAGSATTTAGGNSRFPAINSAGDLIVYLSTANNLVPGQMPPNAQGIGVNNVFLYSVSL